MGTSHVGIWTGRKRHGFGQYFMGTSFEFMTASAFYRLSRPPIVVGAVAMWWGYISSWLRKESRYDDPEFRAFLRKYQRECLIYGKAKAMRRTDERQVAAWKPPE